MRERAQREIDAKLSRGMPKWSLPKGGTLEDRRAERREQRDVMLQMITESDSTTPWDKWKAQSRLGHDFPDPLFADTRQRRRYLDRAATKAQSTMTRFGFVERPGDVPTFLNRHERRAMGAMIRRRAPAARSGKRAAFELAKRRFEETPKDKRSDPKAFTQAVGRWSKRKARR